MVNLTPTNQSLGASAPVVVSPPSSLNASASFAQQLAATLEAYLNQGGNAGAIEIDINPSQSQNSGDRQFIVTIKSPTASIMPGAAAQPVVPAPAPATPSSSTPKTTATDAPIDMSQVSEDSVIRTNQYWALQPPEVQKLRDVPEFEDRVKLGRQLADQGFVIDPTIMVYGWNPYRVMQNRKDAGYTWVPSFSQPAILEPPGFTFPGLPTYDPYNPPQGSIRVTTDFTSATS